jgi:hypothetical protein
MDDLRELVDPLYWNLGDIHLSHVALDCGGDLQGPVAIGNNPRFDTSRWLCLGRPQVVLSFNLDEWIRVHG